MKTRLVFCRPVAVDRHSGTNLLSTHDESSTHLTTTMETGLVLDQIEHSGYLTEDRRCVSCLLRSKARKPSALYDLRINLSHYTLRTVPLLTSLQHGILFTMYLSKPRSRIGKVNTTVMAAGPCLMVLFCLSPCRVSPMLRRRAESNRSLVSYPQLHRIFQRGFKRNTGRGVG